METHEKIELSLSRWGIIGAAALGAAAYVSGDILQNLFLFILGVCIWVGAALMVVAQRADRHFRSSRQPSRSTWATRRRSELGACTAVAIIAATYLVAYFAFEDSSRDAVRLRVIVMGAGLLIGAMLPIWPGLVKLVTKVLAMQKRPMRRPPKAPLEPQDDDHQRTL